MYIVLHYRAQFYFDLKCQSVLCNFLINTVYQTFMSSNYFSGTCEVWILLVELFIMV